MADRTTKVTLVAQVNNYVAAMHQAQEATNKVGKGSEKFNQVTASMNTAAKGAVAFGGAITAVGIAALKTGVQYNTLQQTTRAALTTLLGSAKAANEQMDKLDAFAKSSPFAKQVFITAQQQLLGFGVAADKVLPTLQAIQGTVAAFGGSNDQIAAIADILARLQSQGRLSGDALERLGYYGVDAAKIIGDQMGKTSAEIKDMASKPGGIPVDQIWDPLITGMETKFGGAAANVKKKFSGAMDRVKAAWRDFSSDLAEPLVGKNGGGALVDLLNWTADIMRGFEKLPGPVKTTAAVLIGLVGAVSLLGGTAVLAAPKIIAYRVAIKTLKEESALASKALSGMSLTMKGLGIAALAAAAVAGMKALSDAVDNRLLPSVEKLTNAAKTAKDAQSLFDTAITRVGDDLNVERIIKSADDLHTALSVAKKEASGFAGWMDANLNHNTNVDLFQNFRGSWQKFGKVLADAPDQIQPTMEMIRKQFSLSASEMEQLIRLSPELTTALTQQASDMNVEATSANLVKLALGEIKPAADDATASAEDNAQATADAAEALQKWKDAVADADGSFIDLKGAYDGLVDKNKEVAQSTADATSDSKDSWEDYYDGVSVSLDKWLKDLQKQVDAQSNWEKNMVLLAGKVSQGTLDYLSQLGPEGAPLVAQLVDASDSELAKLDGVMANRADDATASFADALSGAQPVIAAASAQLGEKAAAQIASELAKGTSTVDQVIKKYGLVIWNQPMRVNVSTSEAGSKITQFVNSQTGRTITLNVRANGISTLQNSVSRMVASSRATGGPISGPGTSTSDSIPTMLSNGEYVVNAKQTSKNRSVLEYINSGGVIPGFAGGGLVLRMASGGLASMRDEWNTLRRRGETRSQDPMSLIDRMLDIASELGGKAASAFRSTAYKSEKAFLSLEKQSDNAAKAVEKATDRLSDLKDQASQVSSSVASAVQGSFSAGALGDLGSKKTIQTQTIDGQKIYSVVDQAVKPTSATVAASMKATASAAKAFASKLGQLAKKGYPPAMLTEVASLGVADGTPVVDALLSASASQVASISSSYKTVQLAGASSGRTVSEANYGQLIDAAKDQVAATDKSADKIKAQLSAETTRVVNAITGKLSGSSSSSAATYKTTAALNFRTGPGTNNRIIRTLSKGSSVGEILETKGDWVKVKIGSTTGWVSKDYITKRAAGGPVYGPGSGTSDSIIARISNGEFVVRTSMAQRYRAELEQMNKGTFPAYAGGGYVKPQYASDRGYRPTGSSQTPSQKVVEFNYTAVNPVQRNPIDDVRQMRDMAVTGMVR